MIFVTGDTHTPLDVEKLNSKNFPLGKCLSKCDVVIICGDFGLLWKNEADNSEKYWTKWFNDKPWTTCFIDGNHENFNRLKKLDQVKIFEGVAGQVSDSIFHLKRGEIYTFDDKKFLTIGGAQSVDKMYRVNQISWWPEELLNHSDLNRAIDKLNSCNGVVDYVITHTCPVSIYDHINSESDNFQEKYDDPTMRELEEIKKMITFKRWYFGHWHIDARLTDKFTVLYDTIEQIL